jgi:hypothetical protein
MVAVSAVDWPLQSAPQLEVDGFPDKSVYVSYLLFISLITTCIPWLGINFVFCANREPQKRPFDPPKVQEKACNEADNGAVFSDDSRQWNCESIPSSPIVINQPIFVANSGLSDVAHTDDLT